MRYIILLLSICMSFYVNATDITYQGITFKDLVKHKECKANLVLHTDTTFKYGSDVIKSPIIKLKIRESNGSELTEVWFTKANIKSWQYLDYFDKLDLHDCILIYSNFYNYVIGRKYVGDFLSTFMEDVRDEDAMKNAMEAYILKIDKEGKIIHSIIINDFEIYHPDLPMSVLSTEMDEYPFVSNIRDTFIKYLKMMRSPSK